VQLGLAMIPRFFTSWTRVGVNFWNDQRNIVFKTERRRVVHHQAPTLHRFGSKLPTHGSTSAEECKVTPGKTRRTQNLDRDFLPPEMHRLPLRAWRGQRFQVPEREFPLLKDAEHFLSDRSCGTNHGNPKSLHRESPHCR